MGCSLLPPGCIACSSPLPCPQSCTVSGECCSPLTTAWSFAINSDVRCSPLSCPWSSVDSTVCRIPFSNIWSLEDSATCRCSTEDATSLSGSWRSTDCTSFCTVVISTRVSWFASDMNSSKLLWIPLSSSRSSSTNNRTYTAPEEAILFSKMFPLTLTPEAKVGLINAPETFFTNSNSIPLQSSGNWAFTLL